MKKSSMGTVDDLKPCNGLLSNDEDNVLLNTQEQQKASRGRKLDENVMVKICDMGNGCWTYHHFTPEI
jgi:hypothetical protein